MSGPWEEGWTPTEGAEIKPRVWNQRTEEQLETEMEIAAAKAAVRKKQKFVIASAIDKLKQTEFDPMDLLISVAKGDMLQADHPFLPILKESIDDLEEIIMYQESEGALGKLQQLRLEAASYLNDSWTPMETRVKVAERLMEYTRPKLKQVETIAGWGSGGSNEPLTKEEVVLFNQWFEEVF